MSIGAEVARTSPTSEYPNSARYEKGSCTAVKSPRSIIMRKNAVERLRGALQSISINTVLRCYTGRAGRPSWPTSGAREDDELLGRPGHRDIAVDRSFDAFAEALWVDEDD
jgi:hypothetical protein